mmetsp:Transcript_11482/g.24606  ORF Transcript_11482/g.24606 Transcript_11482/m.24606 type:complete len:294 (-) Transcript_11482:97-978(-)
MQARHAANVDALHTHEEIFDPEHIAREVRSLTTCLVQYLAEEAVAEQYGSITRELESFQILQWSQEERKHSNTRCTEAPMQGNSGGCNVRRRSSGQSCARGSASSSKSPVLRPASRQGRLILGRAVSDIAQDARNACRGNDTALSKLPLSRGPSNAATCSAAPNFGCCRGTAFAQSGARGSSKPCPNPSPKPHACLSRPASFSSQLESQSLAAAMLPREPVKTLFAFEFDQQVASQAARLADRKLQRRISVLSSLQADTIKQERKQRLEMGNPTGKSSTAPLSSASDKYAFKV